MAMRRRFHRGPPRGPQIRVNHRIRVPEVRVVAEDGSMLGVLATDVALRRAREAGLDLVEVNPKTSPPVCKILDFGKYKYEEKKKKSEAKRKATVVEIKEVKLRPKTDDHDLDVKLKRARDFLESGNKVKFTVRFRGREITHPERARMQLDWMVERLEDLSTIELRPTMEGRTMVLIAAPRPQVLQKVQNEKAARAKANAERKHADDSDDHDDEFDGPDSEVDGPDSEVDGPDSEVDGPDSEVDGPDSEVDGPNSEERREVVQGEN